MVPIGTGVQSLNGCLPPGLCESLDGYLFYQANSIFKVCQKPSLVFGLGSGKPLQRKPGWASNSISARGTQRHLFQMCVCVTFMHGDWGKPWGFFIRQGGTNMADPLLHRNTCQKLFFLSDGREGLT